ncbi:serine/arginine-rich splicing factor 4-like [Leptopilina heterotoma]|uniref:serine/arginine-rich splicing factor 4-like n=1 Tax=Leptopilina heterotoma TaxID=63436 RepID=UPI001CA7D17C|nr:serine/arginine-rich splicing factor 4-like [Leptopilina heterotoma]
MSSNGVPKFAALVFNAIRRLQDVQGSTTKEINNYIAQEYNVPNKDIRRQVQLALRRGLSYGILQRAKGGYYVCNKLSPTNALKEVQDESAFCCKYGRSRKKKMKVKKRAGCRSASRRKSRSRKAGCGCKRKSRRKSMKRKCGTRRSRSRSKRRSRKSKRSCRSMKRSSKSMKRKKSKRSSSRSGCPRKPKCGKININNPESNKEGNPNSATSLNSATIPGRPASSNRCADED